MPDLVAQSILIRQHKVVEGADPHTAYKVEVSQQSRSWSLWHRYTDFADLHADMTREVGQAPPVSLPPKRSWVPSWLLSGPSEADFLAERQTALERYLRSLLTHRDDRWRDSYSFTNFISAPASSTKASTGGSDFTVSSWLVEHDALVALARSIRSDVNRRDSMVAKGERTEAHVVNVDAKKRLVGLLARLTSLAAALERFGTEGMAEGELRRRADMVTKLQDETGTLGKLAVATRNVPRDGGRGASSSSSALRPEPVASVARADLLGRSSSPAGRVLGAKAAPVETAQTRPLDNGGLLLLQQEQMAAQDSRLESLVSVVRRQRQLGAEIGQELDLHNQLLDDLSNDVDNSGRKLGQARVQLKKLGS